MTVGRGPGSRARRADMPDVSDTAMRPRVNPVAHVGYADTVSTRPRWCADTKERGLAVSAGAAADDRIAKPQRGVRTAEVRPMRRRRAISSRGPLPWEGEASCPATPRSGGSSKAAKPPGCGPVRPGDAPTGGSSRGD